MITALIIDDEENNRNVLETLLNKHCSDITVVGEADNAGDAFLKINQYKPRLVFLDINMPQKGGFDLLKMFPKIDFEVIFVTAHDNYALKAFEFNAIDYIVKPIDKSKLIRAVEKATGRIATNYTDDLVLHFVKTLSDKNELLNKFSVHRNGKVFFINVSEISFIETIDGKTKLNLFDNSQYFSSKDIGRFEDVLQNMANFVRINKQVIINVDFIGGYSKGEICIIDMKSGQFFEASRRRKTEILKKLNAII